MSSLIQDPVKQKVIWRISQPTTCIEKITPELAKSYLDTCNIDNRKIRPGMVLKYANYMTTGDWVLSDQCISFDLTGKLINGQHRLLAIVQSGITIKAVVARHMPEDSFKYLDQGAPRSKTDLHKYSSQVNTVISGLEKIFMTKKSFSFTQRENARNYLINGIYPLESFIDNLTHTNAKVITSGPAMVAFVYWCDMLATPSDPNTEEKEWLINIYNEIVPAYHSYEKRRLIPERSLAMIKLIDEKKLSHGDGYDICNKFLSFYDPRKRHQQRFRISAEDLTCADIKDWIKKVFGDSQ